MKPQLSFPLGRSVVPIFVLLCCLALPFPSRAASCASTDLSTAKATAFIATSPNLVSMVDVSTSTPSVLCTIAVGTTTTSSPNNLAISPDGKSLYVENDAEATVTIVDLTSAATNTLSLTGITAPITANLAVSPDNKLVYVVSLPNPVGVSGSIPNLSVLDLTVTPLAFATAKPVGTTVALNPEVGVSFVFDSTTTPASVPSAFITIDANTYKWSTSTNSITATALNGGTTTVTGGTVATEPGGTFAFVVDAVGNNLVSKIPTATPTSGSGLSPTPQCSLGHTVAITPDALSAAYSCNSNNFLQVIATGTPAVSSTVDFPAATGSAPTGLAIATDGSAAFVANANGSLHSVALPPPAGTSTAATTTSLGTAAFGGAGIMPVVVSITPTTANVVSGTATTSNFFTANVRFPFSSKPVIWSVSCTAGGAACGSIASTGNNTAQYTAPTAIPNSKVTVIANYPAVPNSTSTFFPVTAQITVTPSQLVFTSQPTSVVAGASISPVVQVSIEDAAGNVDTTATNAITIAIGTNAGSGTLSGTLTQNAVNGVATFSNLSINKTGTGYTLTATATSLTGAISTAFNVTPGAPAGVAFTVEPSNVAAAAAISPAVQLSVQDANGNLVNTATNSVTVAIGANPGGGTLSGTLTVSAVAGVATFSSLSIDKTGTGYTLTAASTGLSGATSATFNVTPGTPAKLAFAVQPSNVASGSSITPAVKVNIEDANNNIVTAASNSVTVAIGSNPGGGTLSGTLTASAVAGVATFSNLSINKVGTGYTLTASMTGVTGATSTAFNVTPGGATKVVFTAQPTNVVAGAAISPAVQVSVEDASNNVVTSATNSITIAIGINPGGGTLSGTVTVNAVAGVASFSTISINKTGTGYTLTASTAGLTGGTSSAFNVTPGSPAMVAFTVQPTSVVAGAPVSPAVQVNVEDINGNLVPTATNSVTVAIGTNPGGGTLSGTLTVNAVAGVATFSTLNINKTGTGYTLTAGATGLTGATSAAFNVTPGMPTQLVFMTEPPANGTAGSPLSPGAVVAVEDALGNVTTSNASVAITSNPANVGGTTTVSAVNGQATFSNLVFTTVGSYTLTAASTGLTNATSTSVAIAPGPPTQLVFTTPPPATSALGGNATPFPVGSPSVAVSVEDNFGNVVTSSTAQITMSSTDLVAGVNGSVGGSLTVIASNGVATFNNLQFTVASGYTLTARTLGLPVATSNQFSITSNITVSLTKTFSTVNIEDRAPAGTTDTFVASTTGDPNTPAPGLGVVWTMISCGGSNNVNNFAPCGSIAPNGAYTPPLTVPSASANTFVVQAAAAADPSKFKAFGPITIASTITVTPAVPSASQNLPVGFSVTPTVSVANDPNNPTLGVTWAVTNCTVSLSLCGSFSGSTYIAPSTYPASSSSTPVTVTFTATSVTDQSKSGSTTLTLVAEAPPVLANPSATLLVSAGMNNSNQVILNLDGLNTANSAGVTVFPACSNFGKVSGNCTFSSATTGAPGSPSTISVALVLSSGAAAPPSPSLPYVVNHPTGHALPLVLMLPLLIFIIAAFRKTNASRLRLSASFVALLVVCALWASACTQFSQPPPVPTPVAPRVSTSGSLTVTISLSGGVFPPSPGQQLSVSVPYTVN